MPRPFAPDYALWKEEFERYPLSSESLLIGHSCGGGFLLRWLTENQVEVAKVLLVAPWLDPDKRKCPEFFQFQIDPSMVSRMAIELFSSNNDGDDIHKSEKRIRAAIPSIEIQHFHNYGHFRHSERKLMSS